MRKCVDAGKFERTYWGMETRDGGKVNVRMRGCVKASKDNKPYRKQEKGNRRREKREWDYAKMRESG